jgi:hypothetical protein
MRARLGKLKAALPLLLAMSIAASGFGELAQAGRCTDAPSNEVASSCSATTCCCSRGANERTACCCCAKKAPAPQSPSSGANKSQSDLELAPWAQPALAVDSIAVRDSATSLSEVRHFSPRRPSVQLLLCIWRI